MLTSNRLFYALAFLGGSTAAHAADATGNLVQAKTGAKIDKPGADLKAVRNHYRSSHLDVTGTYNGIPLSHAMLLGSFDPTRRSTFTF